MSKGMDIQIVRENYQKMSDGELVRIATKDAFGLTPEALEIIKEEITKRGLDINILKGVHAQNKSYTLEEVDDYCDIIRKLNCPVCGASTSKLNATMTSEVISFLFFTQYNIKLKVACPDCLDKANDDALTKTLFLGWWGIPWGLIRTIKAIRINTKSKKTNHLETPNDYLRSFTLAKIGQLETYKDNKEKLQILIAAE